MARIINISVSMTDTLLERVDGLVRRGEYANRSEAMRAGAKEIIHKQYGALKGKVRKEQLSKADKERAYRHFLRDKGRL
jgi:Arc/MetJ-type ribon-helix-helix transcriptional regulator